MRRLAAVGLIGSGIIVFACGGEDGSFFGDQQSPDGGTVDDGLFFPVAPGDDAATRDVPLDSGPVADATVAVCGNQIIEGTEQCDDGDLEGGDGCSATCTLEPDYVCNVPGRPCVLIGSCGDGKLKDGEDCDDGNLDDKDGCSKDCKLELGWVCAIPGTQCVARECGDGYVAGNEECDDKKDGTGCTADCRLKDGYKCPVPGQRCETTTCGDGVKEGTEQCDDGAKAPYDGCSPTCTNEPVCPKTGGACAGVCGDGLLFPGEQCDDGNTKDGDGCSSSCQQEQGFTCEAVTEGLPDEILQPIIYRDFSRGDSGPRTEKVAGCTGAGCPNKHPDMNTYGGSVRGIPGGLFSGPAGNVGVLDADGRPQFKCTAGASACTVTDATSFSQWYRDLPGTTPANRINYTFYDTLRLTRQNRGTPDENYGFDSSAFFPIDGKGFGNQYNFPTPQNEYSDQWDCGGNHNFHFTSELRFWFQYDQLAVTNPPSFAFRGDDDVFVYINGKLAVDIGGIHEKEDGSIVLNPANAALLGLETPAAGAKGKVYEFALFQAERNRCESNYKVTFKGFARAKSVCTPKCGDGVKTRNELCDDGANNDTSTTPAYGKCASDCKSRGAFCGDGTTQNPPEVCDDGLFNGGYNKCKTDCSGPGPRCGDGKIDTLYGELCDDGANNDPTTTPAYGKCASDCRSRPRCGDGIVQPPEQCDGAGVSGRPCAANCVLGSSGPR